MSRQRGSAKFAGQGNGNSPPASTKLSTQLLRSGPLSQVVYLGRTPSQARMSTNAHFLRWSERAGIASRGDPRTLEETESFQPKNCDKSSLLTRVASNLHMIEIGMAVRWREPVETLSVVTKWL